jgi:two-component system chemotaxis response regulator CheY
MFNGLCYCHRGLAHPDGRVAAHGSGDAGCRRPRWPACSRLTRGSLQPFRCGAGRRLVEGTMAVDLSMPILVVDDYSTMIRIITNLLKQIGYQNIDTANDGASALAKLRERSFGLVISDWNMEPMSGYDLLKEVRSDNKLATTPFIMITAESKTENVIAAKRAGVSNYIVKPFNAQTLQHKIAAVFGENPPPPLAA